MRNLISVVLSALVASGLVVTRPVEASGVEQSRSAQKSGSLKVKSVKHFRKPFKSPAPKGATSEKSRAGVTQSMAGGNCDGDSSSSEGCGTGEAEYWEFSFSYFNDLLYAWSSAEVIVSRLPDVSIPGQRTCTVTVRGPNGEAEVGCDDMGGLDNSLGVMGMGRDDRADAIEQVELALFEKHHDACASVEGTLKKDAEKPNSILPYEGAHKAIQAALGSTKPKQGDTVDVQYADGVYRFTLEYFATGKLAWDSPKAVQKSESSCQKSS